jgi:hypothetical protein
MTTLTSSDVARAIGTDAKTLRKFLRADPTFHNVGSGARYGFTAADIPTIKRAFEKWAANKRAGARIPHTTPDPSTLPDRRTKRVYGTPMTQAEFDAVVWAEEDAKRAGEPLVIPRTPTAAMRRDAAEQMAWLNRRLAEIGRSVSQMSMPCDDGSRRSYVGPYARKPYPHPTRRTRERKAV